MAHCMTDLETMGKRPGEVIAALAAVIYNPGSDHVGAKFYMTIDEASCLAVGLTTDDGTVEWWQKPERAEAYAALKINTRPLGEVLDAFSAFYKQHQVDRLWCQGPDFDKSMLEAAYHAAGKTLPWEKTYWIGRDTRGHYELGDVHPAKRVGVHHHALDDCMTQIGDVRESLRRVGLDDVRKPIIRKWVAERRRQLEIGHTTGFDDTYTDGQLARAAAAHMLAASHMEGGAVPAVAHGLSVGLWPWDTTTFRVTDAADSRDKAAALMMAEAERVARAVEREAA
jgi:hypothetical protein